MTWVPADHRVVASISGGKDSAAMSLWLTEQGIEHALLASHLVETPEEIAGHLTELERRGLVVIEGSDLYLPALLQDTASAPTSKNQIPSWSRQVLKLGPALKARVSADLLDVTMRADDERGRRRKDDAVPIYQRLQEALGIHLHALPELAPEPQLSLSLPTERPEVRIVKDDTPVETGAFVDFLDAADVKGTHVPANTPTPPPAHRPLAPQGGDAAGRLRGEPAPDASGAGRRSHHEHVARQSVLPTRRGQETGNSQAGAAQVSGGVRAGEALRLDVVLAELRKLVPEFALQRKYPSHVLKGEVSTGLPGPLHHAIVEGFTQTQAADPPATMDDFRLIAEFIKAGGLHYMPKREWLAHLCNKLPVVLEKAEAWKRDGKPDSGREKKESPSPTEKKPNTAALHYHAPAQRWNTPELRQRVERSRDEAPRHIGELLKAVSGGSSS